MLKESNKNRSWYLNFKLKTSMDKLDSPLTMHISQWRLVAISTANGSLDDLEKLLGLIPDSPEAQLRLFIPMFYANPNASDVPDLRLQLDANFADLNNQSQGLPSH
ncbi:hypothetical protein C8R44DRAFT_738281 [Mycena epipterygia]|nr:hypothetical protein C8R44DRAFT_738281 [Mycena epipterygia]